MDVEYEFQPAFTLMTANLGPGESIKVEPGAMVALSLIHISEPTRPY